MKNVGGFAYTERGPEGRKYLVARDHAPVYEIEEEGPREDSVPTVNPLAVDQRVAWPKPVDFQHVTIGRLADVVDEHPFRIARIQGKFATQRGTTEHYRTQLACAQHNLRFSRQSCG